MIIWEKCFEELLNEWFSIQLKNRTIFKIKNNIEQQLNII